MKVFVVLYETVRGNHVTELLIMRKVYRKASIAVRRWCNDSTLQEVHAFTTDNYSRAADLYLSLYEDDFYKLLSIGEVLMT